MKCPASIKAPTQKTSCRFACMHCRSVDSFHILSFLCSSIVSSASYPFKAKRDPPPRTLGDRACASLTQIVPAFSIDMETNTHLERKHAKAVGLVQPEFFGCWLHVFGNSGEPRARLKGRRRERAEGEWYPMSGGLEKKTEEAEVERVERKQGASKKERQERKFDAS